MVAYYVSHLIGFIYILDMSHDFGIDTQKWDV